MSLPSEATSPDHPKFEHTLTALSAFERFLINQMRFQVNLEVGPLQEQLDSVVQSVHDMAREKRYTDKWNDILLAEFKVYGLQLPFPPPLI